MKIAIRMSEEALQMQEIELEDDEMSEGTVECCGGLTRREQIATAIAAAAVRNDALLRRLDGDLTKIGQCSTGVGEWAAEQADLLLERLYRPRKAEGEARRGGKCAT